MQWISYGKRGKGRRKYKCNIYWRLFHFLHRIYNINHWSFSKYLIISFFSLLELQINDEESTPNNYSQKVKYGRPYSLEKITYAKKAPFKNQRKKRRKENPLILREFSNKLRHQSRELIPISESKWWLRVWSRLLSGLLCLKTPSHGLILSQQSEKGDLCCTGSPCNKKQANSETGTGIGTSAERSVSAH